ncbi:hypothetical protein MGYG_04748 [Nannizzia gypsea CBS 118893]|uniref:Uncharacterized protein n=1 Tax=Arthroderma gypseum (strain ATCC MYA-4604 / CBS 118893) TaxID=535722 RepID=E4UWJ2_ARTGP|nr:hypothetical protein MGYG_04748 [Nannizzia gypsea CBS 118893]EFR01748.1 hypothetical protein MGYG_04748 [Nannizzia gypsea CBS 118893]
MVKNCPLAWMKRIRGAKRAVLRRLRLVPKTSYQGIQAHWLSSSEGRRESSFMLGCLLGSPCARKLMEEDHASFSPSWRGDTSPQPCFAGALYGSIHTRVVNGDISDCRAKDEASSSSSSSLLMLLAVVAVVVVRTSNKSGHFYSAASRDLQEVDKNVDQHFKI